MSQIWVLLRDDDLSHKEVIIFGSTSAPEPTPDPTPQTPDSTPPTVKALRLGANSPNPAFVTVSLLPQTATDPTGPPTPDLTGIFGHQTQIASYVFNKQVGGTGVRRPLQVFYRSNFQTDGSQPNQCIMNMIGNHQSGHPWAGDIVVMKFVGTRIEAYCDITDRDIPPLAYWFIHKTFSSE
ncbi:hypothetical protein RhiJN_25450 [Ceratobasidium sp. AG-Ba]|nr:hypothetical protein RhiJN_25450 [Ceratobasidium sp. AG-Ba]